MLGFFAKKEFKVAVPVTGQVLDITAVADEVFAQKMLGDGFAVEPTGCVVTAPCAGKIVHLADTYHALVIENKGVQIMLHIGLDTVNLAGKGFRPWVQVGQEVKSGDKLVEFDPAVITAAGKKLTTMVTVVNQEEAVSALKKDLTNSDAVLIITYK